MTLRKKSLWTLILLSLASLAFAQGNDQPVQGPFASAKFMNLPVLPSCAMFAPEHGDPMKEPAVLIAKASSGCVIPWHWHTYAEQLGFVSGSAKVEMKDSQPYTMKKGDYVYLPGKHHHQFTCLQSCVFFLGIDGAFDIHYVDKSGNEIPTDQALKKSGSPAKKAPTKK